MKNFLYIVDKSEVKGRSAFAIGTRELLLKALEYKICNLVTPIYNVAMRMAVPSFIYSLSLLKVTLDKNKI